MKLASIGLLGERKEMQRVMELRLLAKSEGPRARESNHPGGSTRVQVSESPRLGDLETEHQDSLQFVNILPLTSNYQGKRNATNNRRQIL